MGQKKVPKNVNKKLEKLEKQHEKGKISYQVLSAEGNRILDKAAKNCSHPNWTDQDGLCPDCGTG